MRYRFKTQIYLNSEYVKVERKHTSSEKLSRGRRFVQVVYSFPKSHAAFLSLAEIARRHNTNWLAECFTLKLSTTICPLNYPLCT